MIGFKEKINRLKKCITLESGKDFKCNIEKRKGFIILDVYDSSSFNLIKDTWIDEYRIEYDDNMNINFNFYFLLKDSILKADAIIKFNEYYNSKVIINKFKL